MSDLLARDAAALHRALEQGGDEVRVSVSRSTAELLAQLMDARAQGRLVVSQNEDEATPAQAAAMLGVSRPQVRRLMDQGALEFRKVGTHHRIPVVSIQAFRAAERSRRAPALAELADLQNELGLTE
ncbi:excisionase family DNA binding protein [Promicromonospora sp. AC04]|uniref:helix-turn-helix domain-containing protein n=1 Tax=Promicromonospora sp. AC04 TaxID=2135723 RepID=UPI000D380F60|nr:helix-turn-helix domain-containing protein [Promicromonospora sp. AC04]PUB31821.1 excisionase family DNA binding protein [Promicromonospora sp. AC04]